MDSILNNHRGVFIISAPSGAGKTSLCQSLLDRHPNISIAISHTTRAPRKGEEHGKEYFFTDKASFEMMIAEDGFLEYANVYGNYYGTSVQSIANCLKQQKQVILEIDWQGAQKVRARAPSVQSIFILPPSYDALENRLRQRGKDSEDVIAKRLKAATEDIAHSHEYDFVVINDSFEHALEKLELVFAGKYEGDSAKDVHDILEEFSN